MSKRTYICPDCRTAKRAETAHGLNTNYRCSQCQGVVVELPWRWRIPKKNDDDGWKELRKFVAEIERDWLPRRNARGKALLAMLDVQIETISRRKDSEAKDSKLKYLRWKRKEIENGYTKQAASQDGKSAGATSPPVS